MDRTWQTRIAAIGGATAITIVAMVMKIDGIYVPMAGLGAVTGIAGYELGLARGGKK